MRILHLVRLVALALFFGGSAAIALVVAPVAFKTLAPDRAAAGAVVGGALHVWEYVSLATLGLALGTSLAMRWLKAPSLLVDLGLGALLAATVFLAAYVTPSLAKARPQGTGEGTEFDRLHHLYVNVFSVELLVALGVIVLAAERKAKS